MSTEQENTAAQKLTLSRTEQQRLERLAKLAGRTPQAMLRFVLRDGFDECEQTVKQSNEADGEFARGESVDHAEVMQSAKLMLAQYDAHRPKIK